MARRNVSCAEYQCEDFAFCYYIQVELLYLSDLLSKSKYLVWRYGQFVNSNLYEEFWKIYTKGDIIRPQYISGESVVERSIIGEGAEIYGEVHNCVIGADVTIEKGAVVRDSIIMKHTRIGAGSQIDKSIIAESVDIGENVVTGVGEEAPNVLKPAVYGFGLVTIAEKSVIPSGVKIGKNTAISGETTVEDYPDGELVSGGAIVKKDGE